MALYLFSAWTLALMFAAVVGTWHGGSAAYGLPAAVGLGGLLLVLVLRRQTWSDAPLRRRPDATAQQTQWAGELCHNISSPSVTIEGPTISFANQAFLALLDYRGRADEVVGLPFTNLLHPVDHARFASLYAIAAGSTPTAADSMLRMVSATGLPVKLHASVSPLPAVPGSLLIQFSPDAAAVPARDDSEHDMPVVLDQIDLVLFKTDTEGRIAYLNRAWERLTGRSVADCRGRLLSAAVHPEERDGVEKSLLSVASGQLDQLVSEVRLVAASGNVFWVMLRAQSCTLPDGDLAGVVGTLTEVTRRRRSEELGSSRRYLNTLLANVPGMVYRGRNDPDWTMEFVSDGCVDLTGYEPWELVDNRRVAFGSLIHPEDREFVWSQVQANLALHKPYQISYRIADVNGVYLWVWEQGRGVFSSQGELLVIEGFITDVSERRGAEERARRRMWFEARTGMTSRPIFDALLAWTLHQFQVSGAPFALLWVDVFGMEDLVPQYSQEVSEQVLAEVARRFRPVSYPGAAVSYLEKHQFAVLLTDFRAGQAARELAGSNELIPAVSKLAARLMQELTATLRVGDSEVVIAAAAGIALGDARYIGIESMFEAARRAATQAVELGSGHCEFADE
ncbi:PAS domain-containing protein [Methyloversatilis sp.]|uniref:PAS domain-containing protein n=1 Tax=Methyloversatilis sp. TaxID=2569862 RepID=UPI0027BAFA5F|nr:PAS domain-containing protein [Methyloversatilis sp.]